MITKKIKNFSIEQICDSGQCFRMKKINDGQFEVIAFGEYVIVSQDGDNVTFSCDESTYENIWKRYFDIGFDYEKVIRSIDKNDKFLCTAASFGSGIRILNQDLFEMIISFIISQRNNIPRIRGSIIKLCEKYGERKTCIIDEKEIIYYDFPKVHVLANLDLSDIKALGVGYRDIYIKRAAEAVYYNDIDLEDLYKKSFDEAKDELLKLYGVGNKVADCILLFSLHHTDAFPMDTHMISIVNREYNGTFPFEKYSGFAGILQQYMFYYDTRVKN